MNLIIELKFLFRNYFFKSFPIEIREGILAFREIKEKFKNNLFVFCIWEAVSLNIERTLITNQIWFYYVIDIQGILPPSVPVAHFILFPCLQAPVPLYNHF